MERLTNQVEGIGYSVDVALNYLMKERLIHLFEDGLHGLTLSETAQRLFNEKWILQMSPELSTMGIEMDVAQRRGYCPSRFLDSDLEAEFQDSEGSLRMDFYGLPAFVIDELVKRELYGETREEVVRRGLESVLNRPEYVIL
ncbi:MAG: hypothetical protein AABW89_04285 [Nanoarchaeota archaeon]